MVAQDSSQSLFLSYLFSWDPAPWTFFHETQSEKKKLAAFALGKIQALG
jgi:hypothetical protein